ncbi:MAG: ATP-binding protein [Comamonadaceae bacterium]|nr:ATP-binding protein [Comamonadaceae bacterium]
MQGTASEWALTVEDHGPGIPDRPDCRSCSAPYASTRRPRAQEGTGLGLVIVKTVVERHGEHRDGPQPTAGAGRTLRRSPRAAWQCRPRPTVVVAPPRRDPHDRAAAVPVLNACILARGGERQDRTYVIGSFAASESHRGKENPVQHLVLPLRAASR